MHARLTLAKLALAKLAPAKLATATLAAAAVLSPAWTARAQDAAVSTARPQPPGLEPPIVAAPPGGGPHVDPARLALASKLYALIGRQTLSANTRSLRAAMSVQLAQSMNDRSSQRARAIVEAVSDGMAAVSPQVASDTIYRMAQDFTSPELTDMLAFYGSPTGRAVTAKMPLLAQQSLVATLAYMPQLMDATRDSYCNRIRCSSAEKKAFDTVSARIAAAHPPG